MPFTRNTRSTQDIHTIISVVICFLLGLGYMQHLIICLYPFKMRRSRSEQSAHPTARTSKQVNSQSRQRQIFDKIITRWGFYISLQPAFKDVTLKTMLSCFECFNWSFLKTFVMLKRLFREIFEEIKKLLQAHQRCHCHVNHWRSYCLTNIIRKQKNNTLNIMLHFRCQFSSNTQISLSNKLWLADIIITLLIMDLMSYQNI